MDIVDKEYIENKFINNLNKNKLFIGIKSINDIDNILDNGIYIIWNTITENGISFPYLLEVYNAVSTGDNNYCRQTLYDSKEGVFKSRHKNTTANNPWTNWNIIEINGTYIKDNSIVRNKLTEDLQERIGIKYVNVDDIDTLKEAGTYITNEYSEITKYNIPYIISVTDVVGSITNSYRQTKLDVNNGILSVRHWNVNETEWSEWEPITINGEYIKDDSITRDKIDKSDTGLFKMYTSQDYDSLTETGVYTVWGVQSDNTVVSSLLFVSNIHTSNYDIIIQKRFGTQDNKLYERRYIDNNWTDWATLPVYITNGQIKIENLRTPLRFPYSHQNSSIFNTVGEFDTIFNIVDSYNGMYIPVLGMQSLINTESNTYFRQLVYDANIGTFKYRSKNLDTNTFNDWTPIQIPYTTINNTSLSENSINNAINTGVYILSNSNALNQTTLCEFIIVHRYNNYVVQVHHSSNNTIKSRTGTVNSNNTVTWNNWVIKQHTYVLFINDTKAFIQSYKDNVLTEATAARITEIITNLKYPTGYDLKLYYRINSDINAIKLNVNAFADKLIGSYFDWDTGTTKYYKISVENNAVKIETKTV